METTGVELPSRPRFRPHPWEQWADGRVWHLVQGRDYPGSTKNFRSYLYCKAEILRQQTRAAYRVRTKATPDGLLVQFVRENG